MNAEHSKALRIDKFRKMETYLEEFFSTWQEGEDIPRSELELRSGKGSNSVLGKQK